MATERTSVSLALGVAIQRLRGRYGWTQQKLADKLGVHLQTVNRYENGHIAVSPSRVEQIAEAFQTTGYHLMRQAFIEAEVRGDVAAEREVAAQLEDWVARGLVKGAVQAPDRLPQPGDDRAEPVGEVAAPRLTVRDAPVAQHMPRVMGGLPFAVREWIQAFLLRLVRARVSEREFERARSLLESEELSAWYAEGSGTRPPTEEEMLDSVRAAGDFIVGELRRRGYKIEEA